MLSVVFVILLGLVSLCWMLLYWMSWHKSVINFRMFKNVCFIFMFEGYDQAWAGLLFNIKITGRYNMERTMTEISRFDIGFENLTEMSIIERHWELMILFKTVKNVSFKIHNHQLKTFLIKNSLISPDLNLFLNYQPF